MIDLSVADANEQRALHSAMGSGNYDGNTVAGTSAGGVVSSSTSNSQPPGATRRAGVLSDLSGAGRTSYFEYSTSASNKK